METTYRNSNATKAVNLPALRNSVSAASFMKFFGDLMETREGLLGSEYPCLRHLRQTVSGRLIATESHQPGHQQPFDQQAARSLLFVYKDFHHSPAEILRGMEPTSFRGTGLSDKRRRR